MEAETGTSDIANDLEAQPIGEVLAPGRKLSLVSLTAVIFFTVCGGAFGIEPLIAKVGAGWAILLIVVTPLLWAAPI